MTGAESLTVMGVVSALVAGIVGAITGYLASYGKKKGELRALREDHEETKRQLAETTRDTEKLKLVIATKGVVGEELRDSVRELTTAVSRALHSMCWLTWSAKEQRVISAERIETYDREIHEVSPIIIGQLSVIAAIDKTTYDQLARCPSDVFQLDHRVALFFANARMTSTFSIDDVAALHEEIVVKLLAFPNEVADVISKTMDRLLGGADGLRNGQNESVAVAAARPKIAR